MSETPSGSRGESERRNRMRNGLILAGFFGVLLSLAYHFNDSIKHLFRPDPNDPRAVSNATGNTPPERIGLKELNLLSESMEYDPLGFYIASVAESRRTILLLSQYNWSPEERARLILRIEQDRDQARRSLGMDPTSGSVPKEARVHNSRFMKVLLPPDVISKLARNDEEWANQARQDGVLVDDEWLVFTQSPDGEGEADE